jgi:hypothetical protein
MEICNVCWSSHQSIDFPEELLPTIMTVLWLHSSCLSCAAQSNTAYTARLFEQDKHAAKFHD